MVFEEKCDYLGAIELVRFPSTPFSGLIWAVLVVRAVVCYQRSKAYNAGRTLPLLLYTTIRCGGRNRGSWGWVFGWVLLTFFHETTTIISPIHNDFARAVTFIR